jgi:Uma2 family endonuclease
VLQPDILFVSNERIHIVTEDNVQGGPDLVIEILSPGTEERDRTFKRSLYARHGVREMWMVSPEAKTVEIYRLTQQGLELSETYSQNDVLTTPLIEGLHLNLSEVF